MASDLRQRDRLRVTYGVEGRPFPVLRTGLLGCGTVGSEVARSLLGDAWTSSIDLKIVAVAHPLKRRSVELDPSVVSTDALGVVKDPEIDLIIELIGGVELPSILIRQALVEGKSVVTANKEVVALHGEELAAVARDRGVGFYFEGAVGGGVPMVAAVTEVLAGDRVRGFTGVLNGTTNYVLTTVAKAGASIPDAIRRAQDQGFAESDPREDLNGLDAGRKAAILASLAFGSRVAPADVFIRGIEDLSLEDIVGAKRFGYETRLVVTAEQYAGFLQVTVEPRAIDLLNPMARVDGSTNTLEVDCDLAGRLVFTGPGAGGRETASAVLSDVRRAIVGRPGPQYSVNHRALRVLSRKDYPGRFVVRCISTDPNATGRIEGCLFSLGVGTERVETVESGGTLEVVLITGIGDRSCISRALGALETEGTQCLSLLKVLENGGSNASPVESCEEHLCSVS